MADAGANPTPPAAAPAPDPLKDALRREQRAATLWWLPPALMKWAEGLGGGSAALAVTFFESAWFPLALIMGALGLVSLLTAAIGISFPFLCWIALLGSLVYLSRYSLAESMLSSVVLCVFAMILYGLRLSELQPTMYFAGTVLFLGLALGASHAGLFRRVAEQSVTLQRMVHQEGRDPTSAPPPAPVPRTRGPASAAGSVESRAPEARTMAALAQLAVVAQAGQLPGALSAALSGALSITAAQLWAIGEDRTTLTLVTNIGPPSVQEGVAISTADDPYLTWFLGQRRALVFDDGERAQLAGQFPESLPSPLLPMATLTVGGRVGALLRATASGRRAHSAEDRKTLAVVAAVAEAALARTGWPGAGRGS
jgi:hypothetical protein